MVALFLRFTSRITSFRELIATGIGECRALLDAMVLRAASASGGHVGGHTMAWNPPSSVAGGFDCCVTP